MQLAQLGISGGLTGDLSSRRRHASSCPCIVWCAVCIAVSHRPGQQQALEEAAERQCKYVTCVFDELERVLAHHGMVHMFGYQSKGHLLLGCSGTER